MKTLATMHVSGSAAALLFAVALGLQSPSAQAADGKTYPATFCQHWGAPPDEHPRPDMMSASQFGRIINDGDRRLGVVCPIVRDSMSGGGLERVKVWAIHRQCAGFGEGQECPDNSECTLRVMNINGENERPGTETVSFRRADESNATEAFMTATFPAVAVPDFTSSSGLGTTGSTLVLFCMIAPDAELSSYYVSEST